MAPWQTGGGIHWVGDSGAFICWAYLVPRWRIAVVVWRRGKGALPEWFRSKDEAFAALERRCEITKEDPESASTWRGVTMPQFAAARETHLGSLVRDETGMSSAHRCLQSC